VFDFHSQSSPFLVIQDPARWQLYFSSTRAGGVLQEPAGDLAGDSDIYVVDVGPNGFLGRPALVASINTTFDDSRPNVRQDTREIFVDSNRPGSQGVDIWTATRESATTAWSAPINVASVNSAGNETRAYLSGDGTTLYFGSTRSDAEGSSDLYLATRVQRNGR
jgi:Tol biopolymer transport system component